jgi:hypothetical protein
MTDTYTPGPEQVLDDLVLDTFITALTAAQNKLSTKAADGVAARLRSAAAKMIEDGDADLLRTAAGRLETVSLRVKATEARQRPKVAPVQPAPLSESELVAEWDRRKMSGWDW